MVCRIRVIWSFFLVQLRVLCVVALQYFRIPSRDSLPVLSLRFWRERGFGEEGLLPHSWMGRSLGRRLCEAPPDMTQVLGSKNVEGRRVDRILENSTVLKPTRKLEVLCLLQQKFNMGEVLREDGPTSPHEV